MATSMKRLAAGVAVVFAFAVAGGPGAISAAADPGFSGSPSGHSRGHGDGARHQRGPRDGDRRGDGRTRSDQGRGPGSIAGRGASTPTPTPSSSPTPASSTTTASRGIVVAPVAPTVAARIAPPLVPVSTGRGGTAPSTPAASIVKPRVVVGNGRTPAPPQHRPAAATVPAAPPVAPAPSPPPIEPTPVPMLGTMTMTMIASPTQPTETQPTDTPPVASPWPRVQPGWPSGALFGIAGLLLAPIAGIWLGHRQARAAKGASELVSR